MPARYKEGARKIFKTKRSPIYKDTESFFEQNIKHWMLRKQIERLQKRGILPPFKDDQKDPWIKRIYAQSMKSRKKT